MHSSHLSVCSSAGSICDGNRASKPDRLILLESRLLRDRRLFRCCDTFSPTIGRSISDNDPSKSWTTTPRNCMVPKYSAKPVTRTVWIEFAGRERGSGEVVKGTPDVLLLLRCVIGKLELAHISERLWISRSKANGFCKVTKTSACSLATRRLFTRSQPSGPE